MPQYNLMCAPQLSVSVVYPSITASSGHLDLKSSDISSQRQLGRRECRSGAKTEHVVHANSNFSITNDESLFSVMSAKAFI